MRREAALELTFPLLRLASAPPSADKAIPEQVVIASGRKKAPAEAEALLRHSRMDQTTSML